MILLAIVLGLLFQVLAQPRWFGMVTGLWLRYCEVFGTWHWFMQQPALFQSLLLCSPVVLFFLALWFLFSGLAWGLGGLVILWLGFVLSADGYRFSQLLALWEVAYQSNGDSKRIASESQQAQSSEADTSIIERRNLTLSHEDAPGWEAIEVGSPSYYERVYGRHGVIESQHDLRAAVLTALTGLNFFLFVPLFWYIWFGPLGALLVALGQAVAASPDLPITLRSSVAQVLGWVSWLPVRVYALTLFLVLRDQPVQISQWWSMVKNRDHSVDQVLEMTLDLIDRPHWRPAESHSGIDHGEGSQWYYPVCQKVLWLWVGAIALLTLIL